MTGERILGYPKALCNQVRRVVLEAGQATLPYYDMAETLNISYKADGSPVTEADRVAEEIIEKGLKAMVPSVPMIGEEAVAEGRIPDLGSSEYAWLVDAVDGTRSFATGNYTVNVALIQNGLPVLGVVYAPVHGEMYAGWGPGEAIRFLEKTGTEKDISVRDIPREGFTVVVNRGAEQNRKLESFLERFKIAKTLHMSSSLKICMIAAGKADLYPRFGQISEWDIAAGDAILRSAGGSIIDLQGQSLTYGHADKNFQSPEFIASAAKIEPDVLLDSLAAP
jgi:3'(2'), 5'-bisphosphate nucleotidase